MSQTVLDPRGNISTPRLRLRGLVPRDAAQIALHASDARVAWMTAVIPHPYPPGLAESFVERARSPEARSRVWALDAGAEGENGLIGLISLRPRGEGEAEIAYWVAPAFWGTGYAGEAVSGVADWAAAHGIAALVAEVFQDNPASIRVLMRAGFAYEGEGETHSLARGAMVPSFRYRKTLWDAGR